MIGDYKIRGVKEMEAKCRKLLAESEDKMTEIMTEVSWIIANEAKENGPFIDRTGNLRKSISGNDTRKDGNVYKSQTSAEGSPSAGMFYATYVELGRYKRPYLGPAIQTSKQKVKDHIGNRVNEMIEDIDK